MQPPRETLDWLYRVLSPVYLDANRTYTDSVQVLTEYPTLRVKTDVYTDETGHSELLLCMFGTIPTVFAQATYRIPIVVWVPREYPQLGPVAYVKPTETMLIHPGNHVDTSGKCYHPYLSSWQTDHTALEFVRILRDVFGKQPPVYAKPPAYQPPPPPEHPPPQHQQQQQHHHHPPPPAQPPLPPKPQEYTPTHTPQHSISTPPLASPREALPQTVHEPQAIQPTQRAQPPPPPPPPPVQNTPDIMDEEGTESPAPAPARPPNPEKLQAIERLKQAMDGIVQQEIEPEMATDDRALQHTEQTLEWMEGQLTRETRETEACNQQCITNQEILQEKTQQAKHVIEDARSRPEPDIDQVVCAENAVYNQLYDLVAEDHAIEDTIYILGKIHDQGKITLDPLMKHTRSLAREQFLKRALIIKTSKQTGLE